MASRIPASVSLRLTSHVIFACRAANRRAAVRMLYLTGWVLVCFSQLLFWPLSAQAQPAVLKGIALQDHRQQPLSASSLKGQVLLLNFVFTGCSSICPLQVVELAQLHAALDSSLPKAQRSRVQFLSVSVDPLSDTPQALATFARRMGADLPAWRFATGHPEALQTLYDRMQVFERRTGASVTGVVAVSGGAKAAPAQVQAAATAAASTRAPTPEDHRSSLYLFGPDGQLVQRFRGVPVDVQRLKAEISRLAQASATEGAR